MAEVAALGLKVDGSPVDKASDSLNRLSSSAERAEDSARGMGRGVDKAGKRAESRLKRVDKASQAVAGSFRIITGALAAAAGGFGFGRIIQEAAGFEDAMLGLQAVSGSTAAEMAKLEEQARTLGATSMFSAQQAGEAQRFLAQAGFEVNEVMSATPGILDLAAAGQIGLAQAADIASNVLGGMRLEVEELSRVNDVLAATAGGANTSISQLGQAMSTVAPLAASAGVSIEETAAAIGTLSDAGIQASRAGTGLQGVFRQLSNVTPQAKEALAAYGVSIEDVNIESRGLAPVLETLREANISTSDAFKIFGSEAGAAAQILVAGADRVDEFTASLQDVDGAAREMALIIGSGLSGSMRSFTSALSESVLQLGDSGLAGGFQKVADTASGVLSVYNGMLPEFARANNLSRDQANNLQTLAGALSATAGAAGALGAAYVATTASAWLLHTAQRAVNAAVRANPYVAAASALIALGGALYNARNATLEMFDTSARVKDWLQAAWIELGNVFTSSMGTAIDKTTGFFGSFGERVASIANGLWATFQALMGNIVDIARWAINRSIGSFVALPKVAATVAKGIYEQFRTAFTSIGEFASAIPEAIATMSTEPFERVAKKTAVAFKSNFSENVAGIRDIVSEAVGTDYIGEAVAFAGEALSDFEERVSDTAFRLRFMNNETEEAASGVGAFGDSSKDAEVDVDDLGKTVIATTDGTKELTKAQKEAQRTAEQWADSIRTLEDRLFPAEAAQRAFRQETILLQTALLDGSISIDRYFEALQRLNTERSRDITGGFMNQVAAEEGNGEADGLQGWLNSTKEAFTDFDNLQKQTAQNFTQGFGQAFSSVLSGSKTFSEALKGVVRSLADSVISAVGEMIAQWLLYQAVSSIGGIFGGLGSIGGLFGGGGGGGFMSQVSTGGVSGVASSFAGIFDNGGTIGSGQWGIAGERGPEIIRGPANVTSRRETADMLQQQTAGVVVNLYEDKRKAGTAEQSTNRDGRQEVNVFVNDIMNDGPRSKAIRKKFNLKPAGR